MRAEAFAVVAAILSAVVAVKSWERRAPQLDSAQDVTASATLAALDKPYHDRWSDEVRVPAAQDHQFYVTAAINSAPAAFLVDTGAGFVALRDSDARRAGIYTAWTEFTQPVRTANGETKAAVVTLAVVEIGAIRVEKVKAFVLPDDQLGVNLLGMSLLSRLDSVEARAGELILRG